MIKILGPFDASEPVLVDCSKDIPLTKQEFKDECDINNIVRRAIESNDKELFQAPGGALYGDFTSIPTFEQAENMIIEAKYQFDLLGPKIKDRFQNNPGALLEFLKDSKNRQEAEDLGLINKKPALPATPEPSPAPPNTR